MSRLCRLRNKTNGEDGQWAYEEITKLREQLAAKDAVIEKLRSAFQTYIDEHEECTDADDWMAMMCSVEAHRVADEALAATERSE